MQIVRKTKAPSSSSLVILHNSNVQSRLRPNTKMSFDIDVRLGKYLPPLERRHYECCEGRHPESVEGTYTFHLASNPIDKVKRLIVAKGRPVGHEHDKVVPYDLYESPKRRVVLSCELQLNRWDGGGSVARARSKVQKADLQAPLSLGAK